MFRTLSYHIITQMLRDDKNFCPPHPESMGLIYLNYILVNLFFYTYPFSFSFLHILLLSPKTLYFSLSTLIIVSHPFLSSLSYKCRNQLIRDRKNTFNLPRP